MTGAAGVASRHTDGSRHTIRVMTVVEPGSNTVRGAAFHRDGLHYAPRVTRQACSTAFG
ncbi:hypothetical protein UA75_18150 [Actinoalloteichus sp. GBA129-24]|uniref:Uncharacterized protein n=1 Tax=Actinoalloteichus fjordicus TaxID=1612552 RepID=A0AAC9LCY1_9PSEU|nr:hypothetical protein UA74_17625 [Actinoalloteichus fjordicus]APU21620.1 hypothetical protein UA75_18150 [Actinoalloteichus sp. GBA129-24]